MGSLLITVLLVPGLIVVVVMVIGGMAHERGTLEEVITARNSAFNFAPASLDELADPGDREVPKVSFT